MIYSIVTMIIKEGMMSEFIEECKKIRPIVKSENGCYMYDYTREIELNLERHEKININRITLFEKWDSMESLNIHSNTPHMISFVNKVSSMRESVIIRTGTEIF